MPSAHLDTGAEAVNSSRASVGRWRRYWRGLAPLRVRIIVSRFRRQLPGAVPWCIAAAHRGAIRLTRRLLPYRAGRRMVALLIESLTPDSTVVTKTRHGSVKFYCPGAMPFKRSVVAEDDTLAWIEGFSEGDVLWDVGANVGEYTVPAAARGLRVWAFEPAAVNFFVLARNVELNQFGDRITALNVALHDRSEIGALWMEHTQIGSSHHMFGGSTTNSACPTTVPLHRQAVVGYTIDDLIKTFDTEFPNHIKLDVDGNEAVILRGARRTLAEPRLSSLLIEVRNDTREQVLQLMHEAGFASPRQLRLKPRSGLADLLFTRG